MRELRSLVIPLLLVTLLAVAAGCGARRSSGDVLAESLAGLMPHGDRDHFVFASEKSVGEAQVERTLTVEHVSALEAGEFEVTESSDGVRMGDSRWLSDETGISLVSEDVEGLGVRLQYEPPLLVFPKPLRAGEHRASTRAAATRLDDGELVGSFKASLLLRSDEVSVDHPLAGDGRAVSLRVTRTIQGPGGALIINVESINAEGVGEVESVAALEGLPVVVRRSLVCGFIQGRPVGRCGDAK